MGRKCTSGYGSRIAALGASAYLVAAAAFFFCIQPSALHAQTNAGVTRRHEIFAGSELENYLRYLKSRDTLSHHSWVRRPFSPREIDLLLSANQNGPWQAHYDLGSRARRGLELEVFPAEIAERFNSTFPYGSNDGAIWAGRGLTTSATGGFFLRAGSFSLTLSPVLFRAENAAFPLAFGRVCPPQCFDARFGGEVDKPQRFGNRPYSVFDPGQSTARVDAFGLSAGVSTANEAWGPVQEYPFLLGNNAAGFIHAFIGSDRPMNILIGRLNLRLIYGRLDQSAYSAVHGSKYFVSENEPGRVRFASGLITSFEPKGVTGLEIGAGRFIHSVWPASGLPRSYAWKPLESILKHSVPLSYGFSDPQAGGDNQLISVFWRWVFPRSGLETYGEIGRDDFSYDVRDLVQEPDHSRAYSLGLRKVFGSTDSSFRAIRAEIFNSELPPLVRLQRGEGGVYIHQVVRQGHTQRGQLLGADVGTGSGAASTLAYDRYYPGGRESLFWERKITQQNGDFYETGVVDPRATDVWHAIGFERTRFAKRADFTGGLTLVREFNRNFAGDAWNLNLKFSAAFGLRRGGGR